MANGMTQHSLHVSENYLFWGFSWTGGFPGVVQIFNITNNVSPTFIANATGITNAGMFEIKRI